MRQRQKPVAKHRAILLAAVAVVTPLVLAGCGSSTSTPVGSAPQAVLEAHSRTLAAKTVRMTFSSHACPGASAAQKKLSNGSGYGAFDFTHDSDQYTLSLPGGQRVETRDIGAVSYSKLPLREPGHRPWIKTVRSADEQGSFKDLIDGLGYLRGIATVHRLGPASIRGVQTTRYQVRIDSDKEAARRGPSALQAQKEADARTGKHTQTEQVWIDRQGRLRQISARVPAPPSGVRSGCQGTASLDFYDFGAAVHISAPPASQVEDLASKPAG